MPAEMPLSLSQRARDELAGLPAGLQSSTLAGAVLALSERLDAGPSDREAATLARELRLALADLRGQATAESEVGIDVGVSEMGD